MQIKSFDEFLTSLCNEFEKLISPLKFSRSNSNFIYLLMKAIAKGLEVINNVCVSLSNKFNPAACSEDDLESVADMVGTEKLKGSFSGLEITATNITEEIITLPEGIYTYELDSETKFNFTLIEPNPVGATSFLKFISLSEKVGSYYVTNQNNITLTAVDSSGANIIIPDNLTFSCADNKSLLGIPEETNTDFRQRILTDTERQGGIEELQVALRNLPYIFDCSLVFNPKTEDMPYDDYVIKPFHLLIVFSGEPRKEIAEIVASHTIFPTVKVPSSIEVRYDSDVFVDKYYSVYLNKYKEIDYKTKVTYTINPTYLTSNRAEAIIKTILLARLNTSTHVDYITEKDVYNIIQEQNVVGLTILNVELQNNEGTNIPYLLVPKSRISKLTDVAFEEIVNE